MDLLNDLIRIDTSNLENTNRAIELCAEYLRQHGVKGEIYDNAGYKSYVTTIGQGDRTLIINGHLDVVSGKPTQFEPIEKGGRIIGRGSADMKGGCVSMIKAMIRLKDQNPACQVMLQLVPDEEVGGEKGTKYLVEKGLTGDFVICTEPTNLMISIQSKGIIILDIETRGVSAHGSRPWEGSNAIKKAMTDFYIIEKLPILHRGSKYYMKSSVNLASITGGNICNMVPDRCNMIVDIRYVPDLDPHEIIDDVGKAINSKFKVKTIEPAVNTKPDDHHIEKLKKSVLRIIPHGTIELVGQHGGSDCRFFSRKGIPAIELGPKGDFWHGDEEYVELDSIKQLENILVDFAMNF